MFTHNQIKEAHSKVKSGKDFPNYIADIKQPGVVSYTTYVRDSHTEYNGANNFKVSSEAKYDTLSISDKSNSVQFLNDLKAHQQGKTEYFTFCKDCAKSGIEKWVADLSNMTCTYFDKSGNEVLVEKIPQVA